MRTYNKVLVTGANGFTGAAVVKSLLNKGYKVKAMILPGTEESNLDGLNVEKVYGNILDKEFLDSVMSDVDVVHHVAAIFDFAASPFVDLRKYEFDCSRFYKNNLEGTISVMLSAMKAKIKRIVYTSTMACIGTTPGRALSNEENMYNIWYPVNDYMRSKGFAEAAVYQFIEAGLPVVIVNPTWTVGPGEVNLTPVGEVIFDVMNGFPPKITPAGINIVDVDDVGAGHVLAQELGKIGERYILGGENVEYDKLIEKIRYFSGLSDKIAFEDKKTDFPKEFLWYNSEKARSELGWNSRPIDDTLIRAISWLKSKK
jgi:dihydroflavonol-4-reductase